MKDVLQKKKKAKSDLIPKGAGENESTVPGLMPPPFTLANANQNQDKSSNSSDGDGIIQGNFLESLSSTASGIIDGVQSGAQQFGGMLADGANYLGDRIGDALNTRPNEAELDAKEDIQDFRNEMIYGPQDMTSSTGKGGFEATYYPWPELLYIKVDSVLNLMDGLSIDASNVITANTTISSRSRTTLQSAVAAGMALPPERRAEYVRGFQFTAEERATRTEQFKVKAAASSALWSNKHEFFVDRPHWNDVNANVSVNFNVLERAAQAGDHVKVDIVKTPDSSNFGAAVSSYGDVTTRTNAMTLDDSDLDPSTHTTDGSLHAQIFFENDSSNLDTATGRFWGSDRTAKQVLNQIAGRWKDDKNLTPDKDDDHNNISNLIQMIGRASSPGSDGHNAELAQARIDAVTAYLQSQGYNGVTYGRLQTDNKGEMGATEDPEWRRVDLIYGSGEVQNTLAHEFGHVLGLGDEYVGGTGGQLGNKTDHSDLSEKIGGGISTHERNDSIMSNGNEVRGMHYATFGEALRTLTNIQEWKLKP